VAGGRRRSAYRTLSLAPDSRASPWARPESSRINPGPTGVHPATACLLRRDIDLIPRFRPDRLIRRWLRPRWRPADPAHA
jgi:hypothetical protein